MCRCTLQRSNAKFKFIDHKRRHGQDQEMSLFAATLGNAARHNSQHRR